MKNYRHKLIIDLITNESIRTQDELRTKLQENGVTVTQATLSRDIKELGLVKADCYRAEHTTLPPIIANSVLSTDHAGNTVVIKCRPGMANAVCAELDQLTLSDVVGTLAGDDTIFVLMRTPQAAAHFSENIS